MRALVLGLLVAPMMASASNSAIQCKTEAPMSGEITLTMSSDTGFLADQSNLRVVSVSQGPFGNRDILATAVRLPTRNPNELRLHLLQTDADNEFILIEAALTLHLETVIQDPLTQVPGKTGVLQIIKGGGRMARQFSLTDCVGSL